MKIWYDELKTREEMTYLKWNPEEEEEVENLWMISYLIQKEYYWKETLVE